MYEAFCFFNSADERFAFKRFDFPKLPLSKTNFLIATNKLLSVIKPNVVSRLQLEN
jgi:hypothetical protein